MVDTFYTVLMLCALPQLGSCQLGLNSAAVPSLSILGAAKGGTTDLYYLVKDLHSGVPPHSRKEENLAALSAPFSAARARCVLLCPNGDAACHQLTSVKTVKDCDRWLNQSGLEGYLQKYPYTVDADPAQIFYFDRYIDKYNELQHETGANTLFLLTLRDPVTAVPSVYNHWTASGQIKEVDGETLETRLKKQFLLLEQPRHWQKLQRISDLVKAGSTEYDVVISLYSSIPQQRQLDEFLLRHIYIVGIMAYATRVKHIKGNFLIARAEHILHDRLSFFYNELVPFLHPNRSQPLSPYSIAPRAVAEDSEKKPRNRKSGYVDAASLSVEMRSKLRKFYDMFPLEPYLHKLQAFGIASVVPPLRNGSFEYSSWKWGV